MEKKYNVHRKLVASQTTNPRQFQHYCHAASTLREVSPFAPSDWATLHCFASQGLLLLVVGFIAHCPGSLQIGASFGPETLRVSPNRTHW